MGTYKVIQDIEAEDKLLGPLSLKQFIFAGITLTCGYLNFLMLSRGAPLLMAFFLPPMLIFGFLAFPWGREQPTEVWLLAKLRFLVKPRKRIWDQSGLKQLVTITAPKVEEKVYTNGLDQDQVQSRLKALANTIDSRGWAVKNVNLNLFDQSHAGLDPNSDRLVDAGSLPQEVVNYEVHSSDDILDPQNNRTAQNLDRMIHATSEAHRQQLLEQMRQQPATKQADGGADYWFMNQPGGPIPQGQAVFDGSATVRPGDDATDSSAGSAGPLSAYEQALLDNLHASKQQAAAAYGHMRTLDPHGDSAKAKAKPHKQKHKTTHAKAKHEADVPAPAPTPPPPPPAPPVDPTILELAHNDDLNVATLARQAHKKRGVSAEDGEVVISLH